MSILTTVAFMLYITSICGQIVSTDVPYHRQLSKQIDTDEFVPISLEVICAGLLEGSEGSSNPHRTLSADISRLASKLDFICQRNSGDVGARKRNSAVKRPYDYIRFGKRSAKLGGNAYDYIRFG